MMTKYMKNPARACAGREGCNHMLVAKWKMKLRSSQDSNVSLSNAGQMVLSTEPLKRGIGAEDVR